jgi:hypothetical protein
MHLFVERYGAVATNLMLNLLLQQRELSKLWFWEKWFHTSEYNKRMADMLDILDETNAVLEYGRLSREAAELVTSFSNDAWHIYRNWGGK